MEAPQRIALEESDLALTDSGYFVLLWRLLKRERLPRISGLSYLRALLTLPEFCAAGATFWVMPSHQSAETNRSWLSGQNCPVSREDCYVAPYYDRGDLEDSALLGLLEVRRPRFVVICLGGGVQERLGYFLRNRLGYRPAIICTGAAIAFLSGDQSTIPGWVDRLFMGWFLRIIGNPRRFLPRYIRSAKLVAQVLKADKLASQPFAVDR
ncbi:MAG TPA: WecB/TagA/CpsF family glycosyltransferase [Tepidisphaeraceae bacterium]|nr:WecB/TagA/CpsF family glycosyltransferase [Tepidisphaeraceae bacterium]